MIKAAMGEKSTEGNRAIERIAVDFRNIIDFPSRMLHLRRISRETKKGG